MTGLLDQAVSSLEGKKSYFSDFGLKLSSRDKLALCSAWKPDGSAKHCPPLPTLI